MSRSTSVVVAAVDAGRLPGGGERNSVASVALETLLRCPLWRDRGAARGMLGRLVRRGELDAAAARIAAAAGRPAPGDADVAAAVGELVGAVEADVARAARDAAAAGGATAAAAGAGGVCAHVCGGVWARARACIVLCASVVLR